MSSSHARSASQRHVLLFVFLSCLAGTALMACGPEEPAPEATFQKALQEVVSAQSREILDFSREQVAGDVYHYSVLLQVGSTPNARLRLHRVVRESAPWRPRSTRQAVMLLHGDFSTFTSNFVPSQGSAAVPPDHGLAVYLARKEIDVWGLDRRWATTPSEAASFSDFAQMGFAAEVEDIGRALLLARLTRGSTGAGWDRMFLAGFSRGGHLAYAYAAVEAKKPAAQRHVKGLIPIDIYAEIAPDDESLRQGACARRDEERAQVEAGMYDSDNGLFVLLASLAASAPSEPSPVFEGLTNRDALLALVAQTSLFYAPKPGYHLAGGVLANEMATGLRYSSEAIIGHWLASAAPHQAMAELADGDALWCGEGPLPLELHLSDIQVPLFYLGAAGGFGDYGVYSTTRVGSSDVSTHIVRRLDASLEAEDFGHADLLFADDAPTLAWQPLASWILRH